LCEAVGGLEMAEMPTCFGSGGGLDTVEVVRCCGGGHDCWGGGGWRILFESLLVSKFVEICRFLVYVVDLYRVGVNRLEVVYELRPLYRSPINFCLTELLFRF
ncbi:hypothetical protein A2U01_0016483, partial [Trifolium medium]|nr:hypothetical protein [Trifolium medium]